MLLPRLGGYEIVEDVEELEGGARLVRLMRKRISKSPVRGDPDVQASEPLLPAN